MSVEAREIFEATSKNVRELLTERGLGLYVPPYQRPFGWDKDKVSKLLEDVLDGCQTLVESAETFTFLGTIITIHDINNVTVHPIVRTQVPAKVLTVIDGQQRLTTLLVIAVALHNQISVAHAKLAKRTKGAPEEAVAWLDQRARQVLDDLASTFHEPQSRDADGNVPLYPRMIRAFEDTWARSESQYCYASPVAHFTHAYASTLTEAARNFSPKKRTGVRGEVDLVERYNQVVKLLDDVAKGKPPKPLDGLPSIDGMARSAPFQRALVGHEFPDEVITYLKSEPADEYSQLLRLVLLSGYVLTRVALTVVRGKNEDYAFAVFESLNTTGEPLTAFETFQPRIVSAEKLERYESSAARGLVDDIRAYLGNFKAGEKLQNATRDLLISFALAETGYKLAKRLPDQRRYLKEQFERHENDSAPRVAFVRHLRDTAVFNQYAWSGTPAVHGLEDVTTDNAKLCLGFLQSAKHSVVVAPLARFYSYALEVDDPQQRAERARAFEGAAMAMTAFSVLWRMSHRGTADIDSQYREIMSGVASLTGFPPLARTGDARRFKDQKQPIAPDLALLKGELKERLKVNGGVADVETFLKEARDIPAFKNGPKFARITLLAAYHDADADPAAPGLITAGKVGLAPCLSHDGWEDDRYFSLEHIAPQTASKDWDKAIYDSKEGVHRIGNLVLLPRDANSSVSNRPWREKRYMYRALGAPTRNAAEAVVAEAAAAGIDVAQSTSELVELSSHLRHLEALGAREDDWTVDFIAARSERILRLAWDRLYGWLK